MIPASLYDAYGAALTENDRQARAALAAIISGLDPSDINAIRDTMLEAYPALVKLYGERAAQVAMEFYIGVREAQRVTAVFYPYLEPMGESERTECIADVRREIGGLYSGKSDIGKFLSTMQGLATNRTMSFADRTLYSLANADPAHPKVALVPHAGACGWCILIGSRGFTNTEQAMENMRHDGCKCTTVIDFDRSNPALEGYYPDDLRQYYDEATHNQKFADEWNAMSKEERAKYVRRTRDRTGAIKEHPGDWGTYVRNRTVQEMNVLLGNTKSSKKGAASSDGFVHKVNVSTTWRHRWGGDSLRGGYMGSDGIFGGR